MKNPLVQLTKAYYDLISGALGIGVYDGIAPNNSGNNYVIIGERQVLQQLDKNDYLTECLFVFQIVTKGLSTGYKKANEYCDMLLDVINSNSTDLIVMNDFRMESQQIESINNLQGLNPADNQFSIIIRVSSKVTELS